MAASNYAHRLTTEIDRLSTGLSGDLDKLADGRPSTIFRLSPIGRHAPATRTVPCSRIFFDQIIEVMPTWLQVNIKQITKIFM